MVRLVAAMSLAQGALNVADFTLAERSAGFARLFLVHLGLWGRTFGP